MRVSVSRNDVRQQGFKRWTVYVGGLPVFDVEASEISVGPHRGTTRVDVMRRTVDGAKRIGAYQQRHGVER